MKKASSRSQRESKGIKSKHIIQICVLLGVCIWLIYQVKYSHEKKKEFFEKDVKKKPESEDGLVKLGRKDLLPGYHKNDDEEEISHGGEEKEEEDEDEDEQDQSKTDKDDEEEKEKEIDMIVEEAREEHYKADDASSAVSHESRITNTNETAQENDFNATMSEVEIKKEPILKLEEAENGDLLNNTTNSTEFLQNETEIMRNRSQKDESEIKTVLELEQTLNESDSNMTNKDSIQDDSRNSTSILENISGENTTKNSRSDDESGEKESSQTLPEEEAEEDSSENSVSQEEMEALTDTQTLPDIRTEGNEEEEEEEAIAAE